MLSTTSRPTETLASTPVLCNGRRMLSRLLALLAATLGLILSAAPAAAEVTVTFHSFNGSLFGRYPHTFVSFEGTLDSTGTHVSENFGFTAKSVTPAVLTSWVRHEVHSEGAEYIAASNIHFSVTVDDATYLAMKAEVFTWEDMPGKFYQLDSNNCVHFVAAIARIAGLEADAPREYVRRPKSWLNYIAAKNPELGAAAVD